MSTIRTEWHGRTPFRYGDRMKRLVVFALLLALVGAACSPSNTNTAVEYTIDGVVAVTDATAWPRFSPLLVKSEVEVTCDGIGDERFRKKCNMDTFLDLRQVIATLSCNDGIGGNYSGLYQSAQVIVSDSSGRIVGLGELLGGQSAYVPTVWSTFTVDNIGVIYRPSCIFKFRVEGLPASEFYSIEIPGENPVALRFVDLEAADWEAEILYGFKSDVVLGPVDAPPPTAPPEPNP